MPHPVLETLDPEQFVTLRNAIEADYATGRVIALPDGWIVSLTEARLFAESDKPTPTGRPDRVSP